MISFKIHFDARINQSLYEDYCRFIFDSIQNNIEDLINSRKYKVRERLVLESSVIKWDIRPPSSIDLAKYVKNCLEMVRDKGEYVIQVSPLQKIENSSTKVSTLVRLLEYGNERIPPYPVIRTVMRYYRKFYSRLFIKFIKERMKS